MSLIKHKLQIKTIPPFLPPVPIDILLFLLPSLIPSCCLKL
jgi:hypothetical protein